MSKNTFLNRLNIVLSSNPINSIFFWLLFYLLKKYNNFEKLKKKISYKISNNKINISKHIFSSVIFLSYYFKALIITKLFQLDLIEILIYFV